MAYVVAVAVAGDPIEMQFKYYNPFEWHKLCSLNPQDGCFGLHLAIVKELNLVLAAEES